MTPQELETIPVGDSGQMFQGDNDAFIVVGFDGRAWSIGWQDGKQVKKRFQVADQPVFGDETWAE